MGASSQEFKPPQHSSNIGHFNTQQLLDAASKGNPYVAAEMQKRGLNPDGSPIRPEWESQQGADGLLKDPYKIAADLSVDQRGLEKYRERALGTGDSAWAKLAKEQQGLEEAGLRDKLGQQAGSAQAQARSSLAMRGGLSGGAAERIAKSGARDQMAGAQNLAAQGAMARGNIGLQDEQMRTQMLGNLPGMELQAMQPQLQNKNIQQWNIDKALNENLQKRAFETNKYNQKMQAWAGQGQAQAIKDSDSGKK